MHPHSNSDEFSHIMQFLRMVSWNAHGELADPKVRKLDGQLESSPRL